MFIEKKQYNYEEDVQTSAFYSVISSTKWPKVALEAIANGWGKNFNEQDPNNQRSLLVNFLGGFPNLLEEQRQLNDVNHRLHKRSTDENDPWEKIALQLMERGANAWIATKPYPFFLQQRYHRGQDGDENKPDFTIKLDGFDQAVHVGFTQVVKQALEHPDCPPVKELEKRFMIYYFERYSDAKGAIVPYMHALVANERFKTIEVLLEHGFNLEIKDDKGQTPLFYANSLEAVEWLLKKGSNPTRKDNNNCLPSLVWRQRLHQNVANPMIRRYQEALLERINELDKEDRVELVRQRALEVLDKGQQRALVQLAKAAEVELKDLTFPSEVSKREQSLLYVASLSLLGKDSLPINGVTLGLKLEQGLHESVAGIPDAFWAQQALNNKSNHSESGWEESYQVVEQIVKKYKQQHPEVQAMSDERLMAVWATMGAMDGTNPAIKMMSKTVADLSLKLTEQERQDFSAQGVYQFNDESLYLQYCYPLIEKKKFNSEIMFQKLEATKSEAEKEELLNSSLFWKSISHYQRSNGHYWTQPSLGLWNYIKATNFEPPLGKISQADFEKLLDEDGPTRLNDGDAETQQMARSWLQRWMLKETEREVILAQGGQEQLELPLKMKRRL